MSTLKRHRLEHEIFDKSIADIQQLFSTDLTLPPLKLRLKDRTPRHTGSLFDRPKVQDKQDKTQPQHQQHQQQHDNYTYKHSTSYTSLFSFGKSKTRETSVEVHETKEIHDSKDTKKIIHTKETPKDHKKKPHRIPQHHHRLLQPQRQEPTSTYKEPVPTDKNWSLWRSEVMSMIDFYANDMELSVDGYAGDEGFEDCVKDILLGQSKSC